MATAPTANDLTRQQLDELDALLQRMLSLPGSGPDPLAATPAPSPMNWRVDPPGPTMTTAPHIAAPLPRPEPEPLPAPVMRTAPAPVPEPEPAVPISDFNFTSPPVTDRRPPIAPPKSTAVQAAAPAKKSAPSGESVPFVLYPLVLLNWAFDSVLGLFGPPGQFLRSGFGKNLLGWIGIGSLAYTTAHIASQQGWLTLPFSLPWPR